MFKFLQNVQGKNVNAQNKAKVALVKGQFVKVDESTGELILAATTADAEGIATIDVVLTDDVAQGLPVSDFDVEQNAIPVGTFAGIRVLEAGERVATDRHTVVGEHAAIVGKYLAVKNGELELSASNAVTKFVCLGWVSVAGNKCLGYKLV